MTVHKKNGNTIYQAVITNGVKTGAGDIGIVFREEIIHETGHAIGFQGHAPDDRSIMFDTVGPGYSPAHPTTLDIQNGTVIYSRPAGNSNPDNDPSAMASSAMAGTYEQAVERVAEENSSFFDPTGSDNQMNRLRMMREKPWEWQEYENTIDNARRLNDKQLKDYENQRNATIREKH